MVTVVDDKKAAYAFSFQEKPEGFHYTKNIKNYIVRLFVFAIISHFAFNFAGGISFICHRND